MLLQAAYAIFYGDLLMMALYRTRPYEVEEGSANRLFDHWMTTCKAQLRSGLKRGEFKTHGQAASWKTSTRCRWPARG